MINFIFFSDKIEKINNIKMIPLEIEKIIMDYKEDLDYNELVVHHRIHYENTLYLIKSFKNINNKYYWINNNRRTITIGPMFKNNHTYCFCFSICLDCNDFVHSSRMFNYNIANLCKCF